MLHNCVTMVSSDTEQFRIFLDKLNREEFRQNALSDIRNLLAFKPARDALTTLRETGISKIVHCLNVQDKSQVDLACDVLSICFDKFAPGDVIKNYTGNMMYLLRHELSCVRKLAIDQVYKAITTDIKVLPIPEYIDVFVATGQMICDENLGVANRAIQITSMLPKEALPKVLEEMKIALDGNNSSKCNAYEVIMNISAKSPEMFNICAEQGYVEFMVSELSSGDVLYLLNILELLSQLAIKPHGMNYLVQHGVLQRIAVLVEDLHSNPLGSLLMPGYMKFFGAIAHHYPREIFDKYPILVESLFDAFNTADQTLLPVALDTLGFIGNTIEGKLCLAALGSKYTMTVQKVGNLIKNSPTDMKVRALHCFANLIGYEQDPAAPITGPIDHRVTLMTREWFRSLSTSPEAMEVLFGICKNPFPDISLAAFNLLDAVCQHQWGEELVARTAGFIEFLLDRRVEFTKDTKEAKFDVIRRLSRSRAFDSNVILRLQAYVEQGAFYAEPSLHVAMEEGD